MKPIPPSQEHVESVVLEYISEGHSPQPFGLHYTQGWAHEVRARFPETGKPNLEPIQEACWSLLAKGLVYLGTHEHFGDPSWEANTCLILTASGKAAVDEGATSPYNERRYLARLDGVVSPLVMSYCLQSAQAFHSRCWDAAVVMMGVAAEATFKELADASLAWRPVLPNKAAEIGKRLDNEQVYARRLSIFRDEIRNRQEHLTRDLRNSVARSTDGALNLVREYRNDSGHPKQVGADQDVALLVLSTGAACLVSLYALKAHFEKHPRAES